MQKECVAVEHRLGLLTTKHSARHGLPANTVN